jgi:hypothetical protein
VTRSRSLVWDSTGVVSVVIRLRASPFAGGAGEAG